MYDILYCLINTVTIGLYPMICFFVNGGLDPAYKLFEQKLLSGIVDGKYKESWSDEYSLEEKLEIFKKFTEKHLYRGAIAGLIVNSITLGLVAWVVTIIALANGKEFSLKLGGHSYSGEFTEVVSDLIVNMAIKIKLIEEVQPISVGTTM